MWPRVVEIMLGLWLCASPFIFQHGGSELSYWWTDLGSAFLILVFGLSSYAKRFRFAHLGTAIVGLWLLGFGYFASPYPPPPALQNDIVVGLLLAMIAIIPNDASKPPLPWRQAVHRSSASTQQT